MDFVTVMNEVLTTINSYLWHNNVLYVVLGTGVLFTIWSCFGQYRALTHGVAVTRGKYDDKDDPGAINHFQALSAALSATVGLGNIGGVAVAIGLGGPGAVFWMWVIGFFGMAIKFTEVTLSMVYRNTDDPENPHGGPMWVVSKGLAKRNLAGLGKTIGWLFCVTLLISAVTGGNMFQAWNVADLTKTYFGVPEIMTGIILALTVGAVIIGGIKRIGAVAGRIVPFMCIAYMIAALYVVFMRLGDVPEVFNLILTAAFSGAEATDAFIGGTFGYAFLWGMKRALFSSEAGQGSSPIAHSAAKTDEPVREGVVAGLEPFIDTLVVCTLTAFVILLSGTWKRPAFVELEKTATWTEIKPDGEDTTAESKWKLEPSRLPETKERTWHADDPVFIIIEGAPNEQSGNDLHKVFGTIRKAGEGGGLEVAWDTKLDGAPRSVRPGVYADYKGATLTAKSFDNVTDGLGKWLVTLAAWLFAISTMISWSYYGEQGIVFMMGTRAVLAYKMVYCALVVVACAGLIKTDAELDNWTTLGTGVMLAVNIPIMLIFAREAMATYHEYIGRLKSGQMKAHEAPSISDIIEGHDHD